MVGEQVRRGPPARKPYTITQRSAFSAPGASVGFASPFCESASAPACLMSEGHYLRNHSCQHNDADGTDERFIVRASCTAYPSLNRRLSCREPVACRDMCCLLLAF